ncbi:MAG: Na+/H+ antiporter [Actinomycetota bacterium]|nr:MAG: Na+/H+ antiporter [Actinomycetota bacterium]
MGHTADVHELLEVLGLLVVVTAVGGVARRYGLSSPLLLVVVGVAASFVPGIPSFELSAEFVLIVVLPPLLYSAALGSSLVGIRANRLTIGLLSVGYVAFCTLVVGLTVHAIVPGLPLAAAFALGAAVAPADAVAATAIGRRLRLPNGLLTVLEGESLLNDATAITLLRVAVAAALTGGFSWLEAAGRLTWASVGGVAIGLVVAVLVSWVRRRLDDPVVETSLSLLTPFIAFLPAEEVGASGVVAVVTTGLVLGHRSAELLGSAARLQAQSVWRTIDFILEGTVFALIGLQLRSILVRLGDYTPADLLLYAVVVCSVVIVSRFVWVFGTAYAGGLLRASRPDRRWRELVVVSWAGMRGVVTLAAAASIPLTVDTGEAFPQRDLIAFLAFCVIAVTLLGQGFTLPPLIRWLNIRRDETQDRLAEAEAAHLAAEQAALRLEELLEAEGALPHGVADRLRQATQSRSLGAWERLGGPGPETPSAAYRRLRVAILQAERAALVAMRDDGRIDDDTLRTLQREVDLEETLLGDQ